MLAVVIMVLLRCNLCISVLYALTLCVWKVRAMRIC